MSPMSLEDVLNRLRALKPQLQHQWGVTELAVFGSLARGEATTQSDVDLMIDYQGNLGMEIVTLGDFLETELGCKVDLLTKPAIRPLVWQFIQGDMRYV